ncbi:MAG: BT_3987 domain-containing protein [Bacteroidales bacterium]
MIKINSIILNVALVFSIGLICTSCLDEIEIPGNDNSKYNTIYMPQAYNNPNVVELKYEDTVQKVIYGAYFGGYGYPAQDIEVQFEVDESLVVLFNEANGSNYDILPSESYSIANAAQIVKGGLSTEPLKVSVNPVQGKLKLFKKYLLPISIKSASSAYSINPNLNTSYFVVSTSLDYSDYPEFDRTNWTAIASSEEPAESNEEFPNNGLALAAIDDALNSFWHTKWSGGNDPLPYVLTIDMNESREVHGFSLFARQSEGGGKPRNIILEVSEDGETWIKVKETILQNIQDEQRFFVDVFVKGRYLKMTVNSTYNDENYTHLANVHAF